MNLPVETLTNEVPLGKDDLVFPEQKMDTQATLGESEPEDMQFYSFMLKQFNETCTQSILQRCAFFSKELP